MLPGQLGVAIASLLQTHFGSKTQVLGSQSVGGGCIHHATRLSTSHGDFFLKYNQLSEADNFKAEVHGLQQLALTQTLRVPKVIGTGSTASHAFLLLEFLESVTPAPNHWECFGEELAALHRHTAPQYGLDQPNYIGRLRQFNRPQGNWIDFFIQERLEIQLKLAERDGVAPPDLRPAFETLYKQLPSLIPEEPASLLHGDLWSGNFVNGPEGYICVVDPAVYHGHREAELAFTTLFGGFHARFYAGYEAAWPMEAGWRERIDLFNLYPLLVHLNLFGSAYLSQIRNILRAY
ncbi:UNVERIFIED_CONTAM: hypothetical protein GTU68_014996 [Idotea baltica]|nr:hypothetical protein [Idotea baltica]